MSQKVLSSVAIDRVDDGLRNLIEVHVRAVLEAQHADLFARRVVDGGAFGQVTQVGDEVGVVIGGAADDPDTGNERGEADADNDAANDHRGEEAREARVNRMGSPQDGMWALDLGCARRPAGEIEPSRLSHPVDSLSRNATSGRPPSQPPLDRLVLTGHGVPAREALWALVADLRSGDPLAPITVAVPSTYAALALRREAGRRPGGMVNVRFLSLNRVAELLGAPFLAAPGRVPLTATRRAGAIRAALDHEGPFRALSTHPATTRAFAATLLDLELLPGDALERLAATGVRAAEVVAIAERVRTLVAGTYTDEDQLRAAAAMVADGSTDLHDLGPLVCFAPRRLSPGSIALVRALARGGGAAAVLALTGDDAADAAMHELAAQLAPDLGRVQVELPAAVPAGHRILSCADADDEARVVVRDIARRVEAGEPLHRMAIAYRNAVPYARPTARASRRGRHPGARPAPGDAA